MLFNLDFANNTILQCFFFFFLFIDLYFLITAVIAKMFNPIEIPIEILTKKPKPEMETHPLIVEPKIRKCSI